MNKKWFTLSWWPKKAKYKSGILQIYKLRMVWYPNPIGNLATRFDCI